MSLPSPLSSEPPTKPPSHLPGPKPPSDPDSDANTPVPRQVDPQQSTPSRHATPLSAGDSNGVVPVPGPWTSSKHPHPATGSELAGDDIEMDSLAPSSHRRRRSSLINPANSANNRHRSPHTRGHAIDEPKISEEGSLGEPLRLEELDVGLSDEDLHDDEETGLTAKERTRKKKKRTRNQLLDQRIVREKVSPEEQKQADRNVMKELLINAGLIGLWYTLSLLISLYNKWMFSPDKLGFPYPMFTTATHMLVQFSLASLALYLFPSFRPTNGHVPNPGELDSPESKKPLMTPLFYLTRIGPCGLATGLDIGLGNTSLQFITLTFYTMCKSSSLAFVLLFAFLFRLESPTYRLTAIIATMTLGVVMMVAGEVSFNLPGFLLVISAAFFSGFRWALTQILLLRNPATSNPFSSIFFLAPVMFVSLLCLAIPVEGVSGLISGLSAIAEEYGTLMAPILLLFPGMIAFFMTAAEFALLQRTSVVTLSIAGIFKEAVTISAAAIVFGDRMTPVNILGLSVTLVAIGAYNYIKIAKMRREAQEDIHRGQEHLLEDQQHTDGPSSSSNDSSDDDEDDSSHHHHPRGRGRGEAANLLRRDSLELSEEVLFTADGAEVVSRPMSRSPDKHLQDRRED
ncbi:triose-phosphate transporter family-domain-containing protein [Triangularia verruculosa]|uniref:Triose-phosphate transporter family-domain-containing protein n=1 Tax=Triangularia verruculosa TaxID=2587418 RepID=A0AAN6XK53_9PEZI|nr:triose-phosphate transporter family-domain-containing protein [Triangularia verruculosa]